MGGEPGITQDESFSFSSTASSTATVMPLEPPSMPLDLKARSVDDEERWADTCYELLDIYLNSERRIEQGREDEARAAALREAVNEIKSYKPGDWVGKCASRSKYDIPSTTTLLLVGPRGSGKSSLVNRILRLFEDKMGCDRAQVSYSMSTTKGTQHLHEYMIPSHLSSFCIYDTCSLSEDLSDNLKLLEKWMTRGVKDGELIVRNSDKASTKDCGKTMDQLKGPVVVVRRRVDFVIFVVSAKSILNSMDNKDKDYTHLLVETFNYPFLSFKDSKPVVVITHGDLLSSKTRALVRAYLGELFGIPPTKQIFDISAHSENDVATTDANSSIVEMLHYSLEQADRNFALKQNLCEKVENFVYVMKEELRKASVIQLIILWLLFLQAFMLLFCIKNA